MTYIMPFFALTGLYWPFGLVLYWVTTNVWTLGQQYVLFRSYPSPRRRPADAADGERPAGAPRRTGPAEAPPRASRPGKHGRRQAGRRAATARAAAAVPRQARASRTAQDGAARRQQRRVGARSQGRQGR